MCDDGKETDIERMFGKDTMTDELERDLTNRNELIESFKGGLKSLAGKSLILEVNSFFLETNIELNYVRFKVANIIIFLFSFNNSIQSTA